MTYRVHHCTVKSGPNKGASFYVQRYYDLGNARYSADCGETWHNTSKNARLAAEANGWTYVTTRQGERLLVNKNAVPYYQHQAA